MSRPREVLEYGDQKVQPESDSEKVRSPDLWLTGARVPWIEGLRFGARVGSTEYRTGIAVKLIRLGSERLSSRIMNALSAVARYCRKYGSRFRQSFGV